MLEKWGKAPTRIGMVVGFVLLPLLWWLQDAMLLHLFGIISWSESELVVYFSAGALPGIILGAGLSKAALAWRKERLADAKWHLISHAATVLLLGILAVAPGFWAQLRRFPGKDLLFEVLLPRWLTVLVSADFLTFLPLHCAFLMLLFGCLMRSKH